MPCRVYISIPPNQDRACHELGGGKIRPKTFFFFLNYFLEVCFSMEFCPRDWATRPPGGCSFTLEPGTATVRSHGWKHFPWRKGSLELGSHVQYRFLMGMKMMLSWLQSPDDRCCASYASCRIKIFFESTNVTNGPHHKILHALVGISSHW